MRSRASFRRPLTTVSIRTRKIIGIIGIIGIRVDCVRRVQSIQLCAPSLTCFLSVLGDEQRRKVKPSETLAIQVMRWCSLSLSLSLGLRKYPWLPSPWGMAESGLQASSFSRQGPDSGKIQELPWRQPRYKVVVVTH